MVRAEIAAANRMVQKHTKYTVVSRTPPGPIQLLIGPFHCDTQNLALVCAQGFQSQTLCAPTLCIGTVRQLNRWSVLHRESAAPSHATQSKQKWTTIRQYFPSTSTKFRDAERHTATPILQPSSLCSPSSHSSSCTSSQKPSHHRRSAMA